ncbi:hypothetical protein [Streptomyces sp. NPDC002209]|uniref:hypothetical protein n=1 Tax=Streptomyces sp. NPDC002209 TaxID=3364638 RepID=UPI0036B81A25
MPQHAQTKPVCRECDGFATATITTGTRNPDGARDTVRVHCPTCRGLGRIAPAVLVRIGR